MDKLTIVSVDGHAQIPQDAWPDYLEKKFHEFLPGLRAENDWYTRVNVNHLAVTQNETTFKIFDTDRAIRDGGVKGLYDRETRLAEMDREGIAAEFSFNGDPRVCGLFFQSSNRNYPMDICQAGVKAYHRWLSDAFGPAKDRLLMVGILGQAPWRNMDEMIEELDWIADRGFRATSMPGFTAYPGQPPLFDKYWDPFWARCEERGLALWMHAGHGEGQGELGRELARVENQLKAKGGNFEEVAESYFKTLNNGKIFESVKPRRAMWQVMMGGVFDRFPRLKLVPNEVYGDWLPRVLKYLDGVFDAHRGELPAKRKPSEYWRSNGLVGLSFIRKCEVALRHEIGIETIAFGRDYPHPEGTWPNTKAWLRDAFAGVPENEIRAMLSENIITALGLDRVAIEAAARKVGFTAQEIFGPGPEASPELIAHFNKRGQYLQKPEGEERLAEMSLMLREDLWRVGSVA
jgi:predicted TIM-barrel fold metal-dependent hydrolase